MLETLGAAGVEKGRVEFAFINGILNQLKTEFVLHSVVANIYLLSSKGVSGRFHFARFLLPHRFYFAPASDNKFCVVDEEEVQYGVKSLSFQGKIFLKS